MASLRSSSNMYVISLVAHHPHTLTHETRLQLAKLSVWSFVLRDTGRTSVRSCSPASCTSGRLYVPPSSESGRLGQPGNHKRLISLWLMDQRTNQKVKGEPTVVMIVIHTSRLAMLGFGSGSDCVLQHGIMLNRCVLLCKFWCTYVLLIHGRD